MQTTAKKYWKNKKKYQEYYPIPKPTSSFFDPFLDLFRFQQFFSTIIKLIFSILSVKINTLEILKMHHRVYRLPPLPNRKDHPLNMILKSEKLNLRNKFSSIPN